MTDDLTGLSNRRGFLIHSERSLNLCLRKNMPVSLAFLDINGLKWINDTFGHQEGDRAIRLLGEAASEVCRDSDIVARLGGDEFVVLFTDADSDGAAQIMTRLETALETRQKEAGLSFTVAVSHGVAAFDPDRYNSVEDVLHEADSRMYERKSPRGLSGRSGWNPLSRPYLAAGRRGGASGSGHPGVHVVPQARFHAVTG